MGFSLRVKCLESLDFHGQLHTKEFSQVCLLVIKLFSLSSKPLIQGLRVSQLLLCLARFALLDSANRGSQERVCEEDGGRSDLPICSLFLSASLSSPWQWHLLPQRYQHQLSSTPSSKLLNFNNPNLFSVFLSPGGRSSLLYLESCKILVPFDFLDLQYLVNNLLYWILCWNS